MREFGEVHFEGPRNMFFPDLVVHFIETTVLR